MSIILKIFKQTFKQISFFNKMYCGTSILTYYYFPSVRNEILINSGLLLSSEIINYFDEQIKKYYLNNTLLCNTIGMINLVTKIGLSSYLSVKFNNYIKLHDSSTIHFGYYINNTLLNIMYLSSYWSSIFGTVSAFSVFCALKIFETLFSDTRRQLQEFIIRAINESRNGNVNQRLTPFLDMFMNKTITEDELNKISPVRCAGLNNNNEFNETACSVCLEECNNKKLHRILPCKHVYHPQCIDEWLLKKSSLCPLCKQDVKIEKQNDINDTREYDTNNTREYDTNNISFMYEYDINNINYPNISNEHKDE